MASVITQVLLFGTGICSLAGPPFPGRAIIYSTVIAVLTLFSFYNGVPTSFSGGPLPWAFLWIFHISSIDKLLTSRQSGPEAAFQRLDEDRSKTANLPPFGWQKLAWAASLVVNLRGVGWNFRVKGVPKQKASASFHPLRTLSAGPHVSPNGEKNASSVPRVTRTSFLTTQSVHLLQNLLLADVFFQLAIRFFWTPSPADTRLQTITHEDLMWDVPMTIMFASGPYFFANAVYTGASIAAVFARISQPEDWPSLFGDIRDVTTVRAFWGSFWPQVIRRPLQNLSRFCTHLFRIPHGTPTSIYLHLHLSFLVSGLLNAHSTLLLPRPANIPRADASIGIFFFFVWQAIAITVEDVVQFAWRNFQSATTGPGRRGSKAGLKAKKSSRQIRLERGTGYLWVGWCLWYSLPWVGDVFLRLRVGERSFLPGTVVGMWVQKYVPIPPGYLSAGV